MNEVTVEEIRMFMSGLCCGGLICFLGWCLGRILEERREQKIPDEHLQGYEKEVIR